MNPVNTHKWAKMPAEKANFRSIQPSPHEEVKNHLAQLLVEKTGIAENVTLETDPETGGQFIQLYVGAGNPINQVLNESHIQGIPIRIIRSNIL